MKLCPQCNERFFEEDLNFCTYDGTPLRSPNGRVGSYDLDGERTTMNRWKVAFFILLLAFVAAGIAGFLILVDKEGRTTAEAPKPAETQPASVTQPSSNVPVVTQPPAPHLAELSQEELIKLLPKNLLRRFHLGEPGQGRPDDIRAISVDGGEFAVMVGSGKLEGSQRGAVERILILKREEEEFLDVTGKSLPARYSSGIIRGQRADARFDDGNPNLTIREPVSSTSVVDECPTCERAYHEVVLQWKGSAYVESERSWDNDKYSVFYAVADALEKKKIDVRARSVIATSLDHEVTRGFPRNGKAGWIVEIRGGDDKSDNAEYELSNGVDQLLITLSRANGQWKAVKIERP